MELTLPLILDACHRGLLSLQHAVDLMRGNIEKIFELSPRDDWVLADLRQTRQVSDRQLRTKCGWSPYCGLELTGWPVATIFQGEYLAIEEIPCLASL